MLTRKFRYDTDDLLIKAIHGENVLFYDKFFTTNCYYIININNKDDTSTINNTEMIKNDIITQIKNYFDITIPPWKSTKMDTVSIILGNNQTVIPIESSGVIQYNDDSSIENVTKVKLMQHNNDSSIENVPKVEFWDLSGPCKPSDEYTFLTSEKYNMKIKSEDYLIAIQCNMLMHNQFLKF